MRHNLCDFLCGHCTIVCGHRCLQKVLVLRENNHFLPQLHRNWECLPSKVKFFCEQFVPPLCSCTTTKGLGNVLKDCCKQLFLVADSTCNSCLFSLTSLLCTFFFLLSAALNTKNSAYLTKKLRISLCLFLHKIAFHFYVIMNTPAAVEALEIHVYNS